MVDKPSPGFSGSPIILIPAGLNNLEEYYFIVGIFYGKRNKDFLANHFRDQNISIFQQWEKEMTG
jgi:hypothetical protein